MNQSLTQEETIIALNNNSLMRSLKRLGVVSVEFNPGSPTRLIIIPYQIHDYTKIWRLIRGKVPIFSLEYQRIELAVTPRLLGGIQ